MHDAIKDKILTLAKEKPRHFAQILKRDKTVLDYINAHVPQNITVFLEQLYYIVYADDGTCEYGNKKKLKSFSGYGFCGKAGVCQCAKLQVSNSVSMSKKAFCDERRKEISIKRNNTVLARYGVSNVGKTPQAILGRAALYSNQEKVAEIVTRVKSTKLDRYGDANYNNNEQRVRTCTARYGVGNTFLITEDNSNPSLEQLRNRSQLENLYPRLTVQEIAVELSVAESTVYRYLNEHGFREPYKSTFEQELVYYLSQLGITNVVTNTRTVIGKELDIYIPEFSLAIEYNGLYWHHDKIPYITKTYHSDKFYACERAGIELLTIFGNSWESHRDLWKSKIRNKLGLTGAAVYARKCSIVKPTTQQVKTLMQNHLQGYCASEIQYGLEYDGRLVAAMTFSKKRVGIGKYRGEDTFELVRYVTSDRVVGGASKLLSYFAKVHNPAQIITYSDNRYSSGSMYRTLGFDLESDNRPGYSYYDPVQKTVLHRYNYAKHRLVSRGYDVNKTEFEITDEMGLLRIWDCGSRTWIKRFRDEH